MILNIRSTRVSTNPDLFQFFLCLFVFLFCFVCLFVCLFCFVFFLFFCFFLGGGGGGGDDDVLSETCSVFIKLDAP